MSKIPDWWHRPRTVSVVVDNESWILDWARLLIIRLRKQGDNAFLCRSHEEVKEGVVSFYLGCVNLTPTEILARNLRNLVVHESNLPQGKGFAPLSWQILEGKKIIPVCLFEAVSATDAGPIIYRDELRFEGHELIEEVRRAQGEITVCLCLRFMNEDIPPEGISQSGEESFYPRRTPKDSELDINKTIAEQFDLLRIVDNERYPAFFRYRNHFYKMNITKYDDKQPEIVETNGS